MDLLQTAADSSATRWCLSVQVRTAPRPRMGAYLAAGPRMLRHLIRARSTRCAAPGCGQPGAACDLDHTVPWLSLASASVAFSV